MLQAVAAHPWWERAKKSCNTGQTQLTALLKQQRHTRMHAIPFTNQQETKEITDSSTFSKKKKQKHSFRPTSTCHGSSTQTTLERKTKKQFQDRLIYLPKTRSTHSVQRNLLCIRRIHSTSTCVSAHILKAGCMSTSKVTTEISRKASLLLKARSCSNFLRSVASNTFLNSRVRSWRYFDCLKHLFRDAWRKTVVNLPPLCARKCAPGEVSLISSRISFVTRGAQPSSICSEVVHDHLVAS